MSSSGGAGPPPSPWSQATELTSRRADTKALVSALREEIQARIKKTNWVADEAKDGSDSFEQAYTVGGHQGKISVLVTVKKDDRYAIEVKGEEK
jgi:hypothetical protein